MSKDQGHAPPEDDLPPPHSGGGAALSDSAATVTHAFGTGAPTEKPRPGTPPSPQTRYEHYEILRREDGTLWSLGSGAMGATYKAFDTRLHCVVALKVIHTALLAERPAFRERFLREARAAASVRHPNIAAVFHLGETTDGQCFYAMEFIDGETLAERVRRRGPMPPLQALEVALQVTQALIVAGQADLIHRDIKPANIMLANTGTVDLSGGSDSVGGSTLAKVIDFGLARSITPTTDQPLTVVGDFVGTPHYASPEQLAGDDDPIDSRSDIFSLGSTLWYLLTGKQPFAGRSFDEIQKLQHQALPVAQLREANVPEPVIALLRAMLAENPAKRPQTPAALAERIVRCRQDTLLLLRGEAFAKAETSRSHSPGSAEQRARPVFFGGVGALALLALVAGGLIWWGIHSGKLSFQVDSKDPGRGGTSSTGAAATSGTPDKSIAVLPFDNQSENREANSFFADGIQDDVLTSLAKIRDLRVISRTSVLSYRDPSTRPNLREIGKGLGVSHILEGGVRRVGNRVRVTARLIDTRTDTQIWGDTYDRELSNALTIQSDIAREIAVSLRARLSPEEQAQVATVRTENTEAQELYWRARGFQTQPEILLDTLRQAEALFKQAIALDPNFAAAHARLAQTIGRIAFNYEPSASRYAEMLSYAQTALHLQPDLGEAHLALGSYHYWWSHDYPRSLDELTIAQRALPNDTEVLRAIGYVQRRQGRWDDARASFQRAALLGPRDPSALEALARFHLDQREWLQAAEAYDRASALAPEAINSRLLRGMVDFHWKGSFDSLRAALASLPPGTDPEGQVTLMRFDLALMEGNLTEGERILDQTTLDTFSPGVTPIYKNYLRGMLYLTRHGPGDAERARAALEAARVQYETDVRKYPQAALRHVDLGLVYAALGWRDAALGEGLYAAQLQPEAIDVIWGSTVSLRLSRLYALLGDIENGLPLLEHLFTVPVDEWNGFSRNDLRVRPEWAAFRKDARFQRLLNAPERR